VDHPAIPELEAEDYLFAIGHKYDSPIPHLGYRSRAKGSRRSDYAKRPRPDRLIGNPSPCAGMPLPINGKCIGQRGITRNASARAMRDGGWHPYSQYIPPTPMPRRGGRARTWEE
jgi:hypothetical protein